MYSEKIHFNFEQASSNILQKFNEKININNVSIFENTQKTQINAINCSAVISSCQNSDYKPDSKDDKNGSIENSKQGNTGDCWLLSGINALSYTEEGKKLIKEALEYQDGQTIVHLKGVGDYVVTDAELADVRKQTDENGQYSSGDDDMLILELAIEKMLDDYANGKLILSNDAPKEIFQELYYKDATSENNSSTDRGRSGIIFNLLSGKEPILTEDFNQTREMLNIFQQNDGKDFVISANGRERFFENNEVELADGSKIELPMRHAYAVKRVTDNTVVIVNPWDSSKEIEITRNSFYMNFAIQTCDLSENGKDLDCFNSISEYTDMELTKEEAQIIEGLSEYDRYCAVKIFETNPKANKWMVKYTLNMGVDELKYILESDNPEEEFKYLEKKLGDHDFSSDKTWLGFGRNYKELTTWLKKIQEDLGEVGLERITNRNLLYNPYISRDLSAQDIYLLSCIPDENWEEAMKLLENNSEMTIEEICQNIKGNKA